MDEDDDILDEDNTHPWFDDDDQENDEGFLIPRSFDGGDLALKVEKCGGFVTISTRNIYFM